MPKVNMEFIPSDNEEEDKIESDAEVESDEEVEDKIESDEEEDKIEIEKPKVKLEKQDLDIDEIFENVKLTKKGVPRKKRPPMTEAHKEKLKGARVKAMAARQAKAKERKAVKELDLEEKELLKKQKIKKVKKLKEEVEEDDNIKPLVNSTINGVASFTKADLEEAQLQAIINYDKIRKTRKKEKQIKTAKDKEEQKLRNTLTQAITPQREFNPYAGCY